MATLTNTKIKDTYDGLLKTTDNDVIGASEKVITDGLGNASVLSIGTASASFSSDIEVNTLTIGLGSGSIATNTALGLDALLSNTSGSGNVSVGQGSLRSNTTGSTNVAVGKDSLRNNTTGGSNTALGYYSLYSNETGVSNTALGYSSLYANTTGGSNTSIGHNALSSNTIGNNNVAIGRSALISSTGSFNTAVGSYSLYSNTANSNIAIGYRSLYNTTTGGLNIAIGNNALDLNTIGLYNTALGHSALYTNETGGSNVALGYRALFQNTASNNTAVGSEALDANTTGLSNVAVGYSSLSNNTTGNTNVAVGKESLRDNTTGDSNVAVGDSALKENTTGYYNTAIGKDSLSLNTTGIYNVAIGISSLTDNTTGQYNIAAGSSSLGNNTEGDYNTALGYYAGNTLTTGSNNIYIGHDADASAADVENEIVIGASATGKGSDTALIAGDNVYLGDGALGGATIERDANPIIKLIDTTNSETFNITNNFSGGQINYNTTTLDHRFKIGGTDKLTIGSSTVSVSGNLAVDTNTLYVDAANNRVGVGGTPSEQLHLINGDDAVFKIESNGTDSTDDARIELTTTNGTFSIQNDRSIGTSGALTFAGNTSNNIVIDHNNGNVGIGTSSPSSALDVTGAISLQNTSIPSAGTARIFSRDTNSYLYLQTGSGNQVQLLDGSQNTLALFNPSLISFSISNSEAMRIDSSGNVGIGVSPESSSILHIKKTTGDAKLTLETADAYDSFINFSAATSEYSIGFDRTDNSFKFCLANNITSSEHMRIDSAGRVGIGTTPSVLLDLLTTSLSAIKLTLGSEAREHNIGAENNGRDLNILPFRHLTLKSGNGIAEGDIYLNGYENVVINTGSSYSEAMRIDSSGVVDIKSAGSASAPSLIIAGDSDTGYFRPATNTIGFTTAGTERMRITSGGDVLIGTQGLPDGTTYYGSGFRADSNGRRTLRMATSFSGLQDLIEFYNPNGYIGKIQTNGSATIYATSSDYRLKENVVEMTGALDRVDALKPSRFNFIADPENTVDGFLAHEVAEVVPEAITGEKDAVDEEGNPIYQGIDQSKIVPLLVGAIKELSAKVAALESQLNA